MKVKMMHIRNTNTKLFFTFLDKDNTSYHWKDSVKNYLKANIKCFFKKKNSHLVDKSTGCFSRGPGFKSLPTYVMAQDCLQLQFHGNLMSTHIK